MIRPVVLGMGCAASALCLYPFGVRSGPLDLALSIVLAVVLAALVVIDVRSFRLPDALTLPLLIVGMALVAPATWSGLAGRALAAISAFALLYGVGECYRRWRGQAGLGLGDAKLYAAAGAWLSVAALGQVLLIAALAALAGVALTRLSGGDVGRHAMIAFGPYLALGFWLTWIFGVRI